MTTTSRTLVAFALSALMLAAGAGCAPTGMGTSSPGTDASSVTSTGSDTKVSAFVADNSVLTFWDDEGAAKLMADMEAGRIPTECNVLFDQMGALPDVTVTDPETITEIYRLVAGMSVAGESGMSITDNYHHVYFTLQDGTKVGYSFEGAGNMLHDGTTYYVTGDGPLWVLTRRLQGVDERWYE